MKNTISVVIPVYNSQSTIEEVVIRVKTAIEHINDLVLAEIILVNDGSKDNSLAICKKINEEISDVVVLNLSQNFGQHNALMAGYANTTGDYVLSLDDDLQTLPEEIHKLYSHIIENDCDVVFAEYEDKKQNGFRKFGSFLNNYMAEVLIKKPKQITLTSFFILKRYLVIEMVKYENAYPHIAGLIFRVTKNAASVLVRHNKREVGKSNYNLFKLLSLWINGFTGFSVKPLRLCTFIGIITFVLCIIFSLYLAIRKMVNPIYEIGWTSIIVAIIFFGGLQLISTGLLGEYIGRTFLSINKCPQYIIKDYYNKKENTNEKK